MPARAFFGFMTVATIEIEKFRTEVYEPSMQEDSLRWFGSVDQAVTLYEIWQMVGMTEIIKKISEEARLQVNFSSEEIHMPVAFSNRIDWMLASLHQTGWCISCFKNGKVVNTEGQKGKVNLDELRGDLFDKWKDYGGEIVERGIFVVQEVCSPAIKVSLKHRRIKDLKREFLIYRFKLDRGRGITLNTQPALDYKTAYRLGYYGYDKVREAIARIIMLEEYPGR